MSDFTGFVHHHEMPDYQRGWAMGLCGMRYEAVGASMAEYLGWLAAMIRSGRLERCGPFARLK